VGGNSLNSNEILDSRRPTSQLRARNTNKIDGGVPPYAAAPNHLTRLSSFWLGEGASKDPHYSALGALLTIAAAIIGLVAGVLFVLSWKIRTFVLGRNFLFDLIIPFSAGISLLIGVLLLSRWSIMWIENHSMPKNKIKFGRKGLIVCGSSVLFAFSCFYRALNIADEGAAMCRGSPTAFNAPVSGRFIATLGEVALVVQVSIYIQETALRLGAIQGLWRSIFEQYTSLPFSTILPVILAETMSWSGVISGNSKFYCAEYVLWMLIALTWAWDSAELLNKSEGYSETVMHAAILLGSIGLFFFNAFFEIPHFFKYQRGGTAAAHIPGLWECIQDESSPLWMKRLPFFFCYFIGCSWSSVAVAYRFMRAFRKASLNSSDSKKA